MKHIFCTFFFLLISPLAVATSYIEPYLGGSVGGTYHNDPTTGEWSIPFSTSFVAGGRLGYQISFVQLGMDVFYNSHYLQRRLDINPSSIAEKTIDKAVNNTVKNTIQKSKSKIPPQFRGILSDTQSSKGFAQGGDGLSLGYPDEAFRHFRPWSVGVYGMINIPFFIDMYGTAFYSFGEYGPHDYHGPGAKIGFGLLTFSVMEIHMDWQFVHYMCRASTCPVNLSRFNWMSVGLSIGMILSSRLLGGSHSPQKEQETHHTYEDKTPHYGTYEDKMLHRMPEEETQGGEVSSQEGTGTTVQVPDHISGSEVSSQEGTGTTVQVPDHISEDKTQREVQGGEEAPQDKTQGRETSPEPLRVYPESPPPQPSHDPPDII